MWPRRIAIGLIAALMLLALPAAAQRSPTRKLPVLVSADEVHFDRDKDIVTAKGNVEISQGSRVMLADNLVYNQRTGIVIATGNVSLTEPTGEILFADRVELTADFKDGTINNFRMLFPDESRFAANTAVRKGGVKTTMRKAVFSPCKLCEKHPDRAPLWQIKASRVIHDQETHDIEYRHAVLEMFGIPIFYTPYLTHPDPTVKRRTGFLTPSLGSDTELGQMVRFPYFITLGPDKDLTVEPVFTTKQRALLALEYRQRFMHGELVSSGSFTRVKRGILTGGLPNDEINRGHIFAKGDFDLGKTWRAGFDVAWTSDDTFLRRYNFGVQEVLTSKAFVEGFSGRNYASATAIHFQGLRLTDDYDSTPIVAPLMTYNLISQPLGAWGRWSVDTTIRGVTRIDGANSQLLSLKGAWRLPLTGSAGDVYTFTALFQGDLYHVSNVPDPSNPAGSKRTGFTGRAFPQLVFDWRYPFVREIGNVRHVIEPRFGISVAPNGGNPSDVPNEDSQDFEFDDTNLFSANRFPGLDRVDRGQRIMYGISSAFYGNEGGQTTLFIGQSFRFRRDATFAGDSGLLRKLSDIVGRVNLRPGKYIDLLYRFRLDSKDFKARRSEVRLAAGPRAFRVNVNYLFFNSLDTTVAEFSNREEITLGVSSQLTQHWSISAHTLRDLTSDGGVLSNGLRIQYQDECLLFTADFQRTFTQDRDLKPSDRILFRLVFKHLGEFRTSN